ncbi:spore germination protein GerW family protein [Actinoplanes sp. NPDC049118]|uniref:spore germination protein GerW family protein n=1 Tax=Actinoplanes sp. NPDC049118 TaxID=3155769 RepID=UPI0033E16123
MTVNSVQDAGLLDTLQEAVDTATVGKAFGAPILHEGALLLPVARVGGGAGGGSGSGQEDEGRQGRGMGGGFGTATKPLGVFVLKDNEVSWRPVVDVNRIVLGGQLVAVAALLVVRALIKRRARN